MSCVRPCQALFPTHPPSHDAHAVQNQYGIIKQNNGLLDTKFLFFDGWPCWLCSELCVCVCVCG
jgi:hypothetical protein